MKKIRSGPLLWVGVALSLAGVLRHASSPLCAGHLEEPALSQTQNVVYLDSKCQSTSKQSDAWRVVYRQVFQTGGKRYGLLVSKYQDGSSQLCLTEPDGSQGRRLAAPTLQNQFIGDISHEGGFSFVLVVNDGNGRLVVVTRYRLSLNNPSSPHLTVLKQWSGPPVMTESVR